MHVVQKFAALGEMTGGIAHDFGNILAVIDASLRLAERNLDRPEFVRRYIAAAHEGLERGAKLTSQLMAFAKRPESEVYGGDANACLINLEPLLRYSAGPQNPICLDLKQNLPRCLIDRIQFDVAILNLVNNARDAMSGQGGEIRIKTELCACEACSYVRVRVEDRGAGMSAETLNKVFDPFFTTKGEKGNGIGLPQVHASMRLVGGYERYERTRPRNSGRSHVSGS
jgi:signal transduction histidine kinase